MEILRIPIGIRDITNEKRGIKKGIRNIPVGMGRITIEMYGI